MTTAVPESGLPDWPSILENWGFAHGGAVAAGRIKTTPEDFQVFEHMDVSPTGEGEHIWVQIRKSCQNTDQVAKQLARFSNVAYRDIGYSGLKDFFAVTEQWFSIWLPGREDPDWSKFSMHGVSILQHIRHHRKIKRGTHSSNHFCITVRDVPTETAALTERLELLRRCGVPNYFGAQRFGNHANNMQQARELLNGSKKVNNRNLRSILLSAARSWLFNAVVSERVKAGTWQLLQPGEPANLDGSGSVFNAEQSAAEAARLLSLDIHPTAPLWGEFSDAKVCLYQALHDWEYEVLQDYRDISDGLCAARLAYQRRPLRMRVEELQWRWVDERLELKFALQKGQYATSVLRELVAETPAANAAPA